MWRHVLVPALLSVADSHQLEALGSWPSRRCCLRALGLATYACTSLRVERAVAVVQAAPIVEEFSFSEAKLGLELDQGPGGRVRIERIRPDSPAIARGIAPLSVILSVNGQSTAGLSAAQVQSLVRSAARPVRLQLDASEFRALSSTDQTRAAATALGMESDSLRIELLTGPQDASCGFKTRASDVVEVEFSARVAASGREFDSSAQRSGRPYAFMLGNGDVLRGLELGTLEMCIGEERRLVVPPRLGFGTRGSKAFGVPPDAVLEYRVRLLSINMQTDPRARRDSFDDEQRF